MTNRIKYKLIPLFIIIQYISTAAHAQSAYHGGKGDGYASAEVKNVVLGIDPEPGTSYLVNLYPNPVSTSQNLEIICEDAKGYSIDITDLTGKIMMTRNTSQEKIIIPLGNLGTGAYLVRIHHNDSYYLRKLVIMP
jgi:hypothetical protein